MKSFTKQIGAFMIASALVLAPVAGMGLSVKTVGADTEDHAYKFFYERLFNDERAKKFYSAYDALGKSGAFKNGKLEYDLVSNGYADGADVSAYVNGTDNRLVKAFGAGRDAYIMDHPDLFYVDLFGTSVSAGKMGDAYAAYLDSSRALSLYTGSFNTAESVENAIATYEAKLGEIVSGAEASGGGTVDKIAYVNRYISEHTEYSFGTEISDGKNVDTPAAAYISTSYGALVNGKAICGGFAKGFKAVMDRLEIPCVCVQGYAKSNSSSQYEAHMWNYVEVEGMWYAVDVTYNATGSQLDKYLLVGGETLFENHMEDKVISTSGYELQYPALKPYDYGENTDDNGMTIDGKYSDSSDGTGKILTVDVSFEDKNMGSLKEEGKYFIFRTGDTDKDTKEVKWTRWVDPEGFNIAFSPICVDRETYTQFLLHAGIEYIQFALTDIAPDSGTFIEGMPEATYPNSPEYGENAGKVLNYVYTESALTQEHFIGEISAPYHNNGFGSYVPAPGASLVTPSNTGELRVDQSYDIRIVYNTKLELAENGKPAGMDFTTSRGNDTVKKHAVLSDFSWDGDRTVTFKFTPSRMYIHNLAYYYFTPVNLVGEDSKKVPDFVSFTFKGKSVVCSKMLGGGRLYMNVFGAPQILDNSDLSVTDFKDENGNYYAASQRSQLMLVASKPSAEQEDKMDEVLKRDTPVKEEDIVTSSTYEINLQICGVVQKVPNGSYMQVSFGFPEGYDANDAGTTFKIYHYKHDAHGNITGVEEIPVIITEYGLIAKVTSFSPFTIVQIKNTSAAVTESSAKNVYAYVNGIGGTLKSNGAGGLVSVDGKSITYGLAADEGYQVGYVRLNGKVLDAKRYADGKLTLNADELENGNMLEACFVTEESAQSYAAKGMSVYYGDPASYSPGSDSTAIVVVCVVVGVAVIAGSAFIVWWFKFRKPKAEAPAGATDGKKNENAASAKKNTNAEKSANAKKNNSATKNGKKK